MLTPHIALLASALAATTQSTAPDPLDMLWTFGAHEPYTMYRRMGTRKLVGSAPRTPNADSR